MKHTVYRSYVLQQDLYVIAWSFQFAIAYVFVMSLRQLAPGCLGVAGMFSKIHQSQQAALCQMHSAPLMTFYAKISQISLALLMTKPSQLWQDKLSLDIRGF